MYYKKYFSGSVDATTSTTAYYMGTDKIATGTAYRTAHLKNRSDVIGNALVDTFKDIGYPNACWDSTSGYFFIDKTNSLCGVYISVTTSYLLMADGVVTSAYPSRISGSTNTNIGTSTSFANYNLSSSNPFSVTGATIANYAFYVTIIGEPTGQFFVYIGSYSNHSAMTMGFALCIGTDKRDDSKIFGFSGYAASNMRALQLMRYSTADLLADTYLYAADTFTMNNELVVLIPRFTNYAFLFINNTYFNPGFSTYGFYEIDDEVYWVQQYFMTKCVTTI